MEVLLKRYYRYHFADCWPTTSVELLRQGANLISFSSWGFHFVYGNSSKANTLITTTELSWNGPILQDWFVTAAPLCCFRGNQVINIRYNHFLTDQTAAVSSKHIILLSLATYSQTYQFYFRWYFHSVLAYSTCQRLCSCIIFTVFVFAHRGAVKCRVLLSPLAPIMFSCHYIL